MAFTATREEEHLNHLALKLSWVMFHQTGKLSVGELVYVLQTLWVGCTNAMTLLLQNQVCCHVGCYI